MLDVRLLRAGNGAWRLDSIGSVGGTPARRPRTLTTAARKALRHPRITFTDSARWDIQRGAVDDPLLLALAREADQAALSVLVIQSGHPENVWNTTRRSAHADGRAADIHAVDGELVTTQRQPGSPVYELGKRLVAAGAEQVGSPWDLAAGARGFTDPVHQDHLHLQQST